MPGRDPSRLKPVRSEAQTEEVRDVAKATCQPCRQAAKTLKLLDERIDSSSLMPPRPPTLNLSAGTTGCVECGGVWSTPGPTFFSPRGLLHTHMGHHIIIQRTDTDQRLARVREDLSIEYLSQREVLPRKAPQCTMHCNENNTAGYGHVPAHCCVLPEGHAEVHQFNCKGTCQAISGTGLKCKFDEGHESPHTAGGVVWTILHLTTGFTIVCGARVMLESETTLHPDLVTCPTCKQRWEAAEAGRADLPAGAPRTLPSGEREKCGGCGTEGPCYYLSQYGKGAICQRCRDEETTRAAEQTKGQL